MIAWRRSTGSASERSTPRLIALIVLLALGLIVTIEALFVYTLTRDQRQQAFEGGSRAAFQLDRVLQQLTPLSFEQRQRLALSLSGFSQTVKVERVRPISGRPETIVALSRGARAESRFVAERYLSDVRVETSNPLAQDSFTLPGFTSIRTIGRFPDGNWATVVQPLPILSWFARLRLLLWGGLLGVSVLLIAYLLARRLLRPVQTFASAAERLAENIDADPLPLEGPQEIRAARAAFNSMQRSLQDMIATRGRMIAALSHDLRTAIMRIQLKTERLDNPAEREPLLHELSALTAMVTQTIEYYRGRSRSLQKTAVRLDFLVESLIDDLAETENLPVEAIALASCTVQAEDVSLTRAIDNLIRNAVLYGTRCYVRLIAAEDHCALWFSDDGEGIPLSKQREVFEPFRRLDQARSGNTKASTPGTGLGLSIAQEIVEQHGGKINFNRDPEGRFAVVIELRPD